MNKKLNKPLLIICAVLIVALTTIVSYAWYSANVEGNNEAEETVINTGQMALKLTDGQEMNLSNAAPGTSINKTFKVKNTGDITTTYDVYLSEIFNNFADKNDLVYTLTSPTGCQTTTQTVVPDVVGETSKIVSSCSINAGVEHEYTLTITYKNDNSNQDDNKGKSFSAKISVNEYSVYSNLPERIEFETATLTGTDSVIPKVKNLATASNGQYVKDSDNGTMGSNDFKPGYITITYNSATGGFYNLKISTAHSSSHHKVQLLFINDDYQGDFTFAPNEGNSSTNFQLVDLGVIKLKQGNNTITIKSKYGYQSYDYLELQKISDIQATSLASNLIDTNATTQTNCLYSYLKSIYGQYTLSGQQELYRNSREDEFEYLLTNTGKQPAIRGFDYGSEINPMYVDEYGTTNRIKDWVLNKGGIAAITLDLRVPKNVNSWAAGTQIGYENATATLGSSNFQIANVFKSGTNEKRYIDEMIYNLAGKLSELQTSNIPVILRIMQESEGNGGDDGYGAWFWWGQQGKENYKYLYRYFVKELKEHYNLHNIIYTTTVYSTPDYSEKWYPGDNYVDIIGYDRYTRIETSPNYGASESTFYSLINIYNHSKMISMAENDTVISASKMSANNAQWLYFLNWYDNYLYDSQFNTPESLSATYNAANVITLDELPNTLYSCSN